MSPSHFTPRPLTSMEEIKQPVSSQPQSTTPMHVGPVGGNRNGRNCPVGPDGTRGWSFGLFDCFTRCGLCCCSIWCPCVVFSKNKQRLLHLQTRGTPLPGGGESIDSQCCIYCALDIFACSWILQINTRAEVRQRYSIRGGACGDCFKSWCCRSCTLTQERREIEVEEYSFSK